MSTTTTADGLRPFEWSTGRTDSPHISELLDGLRARNAERHLAEGYREMAEADREMAEADMHAGFETLPDW